jgi:hypothetical protein
MTISRSILGGATALVLALALSATPALADRGRGHGRHKEKGKVHRVERHRDHDRDRHRSAYRYRDDDRHRHAYRRDHRPIYRSVVRERFVVPHRIARPHVYDRYFSGRVYFAPHRHAHVVYAFPVYTPYGVEYEPHYYCGPELYVEHPGYAYDSDYRSRRPRVSIGVHLGF